MIVDWTLKTLIYLYISYTNMISFLECLILCLVLSSISLALIYPAPFPRHFTLSITFIIFCSEHYPQKTGY